MDSDPKVKCKTCKKDIDPLDVFPKGNCLECHAAIWDRVPVSEIPKPDFTKVFRKRR
jgi:hypothetical protein